MLLLLLTLTANAGVELGSYGRVQVSSDLDGGHGDAVDVVSHGTRLEKSPYLELDVVFGRRLDDGSLFEVVVTPALQGDLFHYDGEWDADLAVRNLYVQASDFSSIPLSAWAGSRMYRGDDVHLLDFWPLDELNTVGGGLDWKPGDWTVSVHTGLNRLTAEEYQVQWRDVPGEGGLDTETVLFMDRQRSVSSLKVDRLLPSGGDVTFRVRAYGELQVLPEGTRVEEEQLLERTLPSDLGSVVGLQLSAWGWANDSHTHVFLRRATGLAAYDELAVPTYGFDTDYRVAGATEYMAAIAGNHETDRLGLLWGGYVRRFEDADSIEVDVDDRWEAAVAVRPIWFTGEHTSLGLELSHQWLRPDGLNPHTRDHDVPQVTKLALLPALQLAPGSFSRPQIRLQYIASYLNDDARLWFDERDERHRANLQHFVGIGAEWWLNSRSYR